MGVITSIFLFGRFMATVTGPAYFTDLLGSGYDSHLILRQVQLDKFDSTIFKHFIH